MVNNCENAGCQVYLPLTEPISQVKKSVRHDAVCHNDGLHQVDYIANTANKPVSVSLAGTLRNMLSLPFSRCMPEDQKKSYELMDVVSTSSPYSQNNHQHRVRSPDDEPQKHKQDYAFITSKMMLGTSAVLLVTAGAYLFRHYLKSISMTDELTTIEALTEAPNPLALLQNNFPSFYYDIDDEFTADTGSADVLSEGNFPEYHFDYDAGVLRQ